MIIFAFAGIGKTSLAKKHDGVVDLELSDIKYDNRSVSHLSREARKSTKRPIKDVAYQTTYIQKAFALEQEGKIVLVALNFLVPMLLEMRKRKSYDFHILIPHPGLRKEYKSRYQTRGNNPTFIFEVMAIWYPILIPLYLLSFLFPRLMTVTAAGETLEDAFPRIVPPDRLRK